MKFVLNRRMFRRFCTQSKARVVLKELIYCTFFTVLLNAGVKTSNAPSSHLIFRHEGVNTGGCFVAGEALEVSLVRLPIVLKVLFGEK